MRKNQIITGNDIVSSKDQGLCPKLSNNEQQYLNGKGNWSSLPESSQIYSGTSSTPPSEWKDGDIYVQYEE